MCLCGLDFAPVLLFCIGRLRVGQVATDLAICSMSTGSGSMCKNMLLPGMTPEPSAEQVPLAVIGGHKKAVSYVRWMDGTRLISASTDNQLKLWDVNSGNVASAQHDRRPVNVLSGGHDLDIMCAP